MSTTTATPETPVSGTPLVAGPYTAAAQAYIDQLRAMRPQIPNFTFAPSKPISKSLIANASVPDAFVETVSVGINNAPRLAVDGANAELLRDLMFRAVAFAAVEDELGATKAATHHTVTEARHQAGTIALFVYAVAKRLVKKPGNADLIPVVEAMQSALGRKQPRPRKKAAPKPTPVSTSHPSMESSQEPPPPTAEKLS
jgi:hypothetical protein